MFGPLNTSQIYGIEHDQQQSATTTTTINKNPNPAAYLSANNTNTNTSTTTTNTTKVKPHRRSTSCVSETVKENKFFASLSSIQQGIKSPTNFLESLLSGYDSLRNYSYNSNNSHNTSNSNFYANLSPPTPTGGENTKTPLPQSNSSVAASAEGLLNTFNCLQRNYRTSDSSDIYEVVNVARTSTTSPETETETGTETTVTKSPSRRATIGTASEMTIKYSKNLLVEPAQPQSPATLQNYQKLPDFIHDHHHQHHHQHQQHHLNRSGGNLPAGMIPLSSTGNSSGASSGEFNQQNNGNISGIAQSIVQSVERESTSSGGLSNAASNLYKKLSFGSRSNKNMDVTPAPTNEVASDNSTSSISTTTTATSNSSNSKSKKTTDLQRTSSASSSGDCAKTITITTSTTHGCGNALPSNQTILSPERAQRRKLMQMISNYDQQNKLLQRELAKEKRRRTEELACVVKSLLCFEAKLKTDMKAVNGRLAERDVEICRLVQQNRMLRQGLVQFKRAERESAHDEGVVEDGGEDGDEVGKLEMPNADDDDDEKALLVDCLVPEALQCFNCRKQFYNIETNTDDNRMQQGTTMAGGCNKEGHVASIGNRKKDDQSKSGGTLTKKSEHGCSSSDDTTVSSSFYGARRSVRYTSKRTSGTFREYMRSRAMHIDDDGDVDGRDGDDDYDDDDRAKHSEENTSTISRDDSQTTSSYEKINVYSRTIERMHGLKNNHHNENERIDASIRSGSRLSSNGSSNSNKIETPNEDDDDGIFSPTQDDDDDDDDFEEDNLIKTNLKIVARRSTEFSEASPKQIYETSTDDWYASASDVEDTTNAKAYVRLPTSTATSAARTHSHSHSTSSSSSVNPVLECVNQILLQQSMEECERRLNIKPVVAVVAPMQTNKATKSGSLQISTTPPKTITITSNNNSMDTHHIHTPSATNLPRRSSLSDRRNPRNNNNNNNRSTTGSDAEGGGIGSGQGTLTRKRVHFSTKNSMVHVPRNDDISDDDEDEDAVVELRNRHHEHEHDAMISRRHEQQQLYYPMNGNYSPPQGTTNIIISKRLIECDSRSLPPDTLNYESVYSNAYEPIGSERNSSSACTNLYVDMEAGNGKLTNHLTSTTNKRSSTVGRDIKLLTKMPPALPPKPANLLKFRKALQQLDEVPDETVIDCGASTVTTEPDYCSIADVVTSVQIVADVHKAPTTTSSSSASEIDVHTIGRKHIEMIDEEDDGTGSQRTEELEEIFADIPRLPNVAAIIAPKPKNVKQSQTTSKQSDYLPMTSKLLSPGTATNGRQLLAATATTPLKLQLNASLTSSTATASPTTNSMHQQYKRKHVPNILAEINKRISLPNSPTTPTTTPSLAMKSNIIHSPNNMLLKKIEETSPALPLEAEFDWYNLDAEYGRAPAPHHSVVDSLNGVIGVGSKMLAEIHEEHNECSLSNTMNADEYNLDEEFSLHNEKSYDDIHCLKITATGEQMHTLSTITPSIYNENSSIAEDSMPIVSSPTILCNNTANSMNNSNINNNNGNNNNKAKRIKKNLANFDKFIEGSGLSTKPLPSRRKIYFAGPV